jgi:hypothetical protein
VGVFLAQSLKPHGVYGVVSGQLLCLVGELCQSLFRTSTGYRAVPPFFGGLGEQLLPHIFQLLLHYTVMARLNYLT